MTVCVRSKYNFLVSMEDGTLLLSNVLNNASVYVPRTERNDVEDVLASSWDKLSSSWTSTHEKLYQLGFLVEADKNEARLVDYYRDSMIFSEDLLCLTFIPTDGCNFRCRYCYQEGPTHVMGNADVDRIKRFLTKNVRKYQGLYISWFGGEPLLVADLVVEIMEYAGAVCKRERKPLYGNITTNGYNLDLELFERLQKAHVLTYMVTLDGPKKIHNYQRPHFADLDSYQRIFDNLCSIRDGAKQRNFRIGIRANISPIMFPYLDEYINMYTTEFGHDKRFGLIWEWVKDWGGDRICSNTELLMNQESYLEYKVYYEKAISLGIQIDQGQAMSRLGSDLCIASKKNGFLINYDCRVYKCAMALYDPDIEDMNCIGEITQNGSLVIDEYKNAIWTHVSEDLDGCQNCTHYPECMGLICPLAANIRHISQCPGTLQANRELIEKDRYRLGLYYPF